MEARDLLIDAVLNQTAQHNVLQAFDLAWAELEKTCPTDNQSRHRLATMMLAFASEDTPNSHTLKEVTLEALKRPDGGVAEA